MYAIYSRGELIALVKSPRYVMLNTDGVFVETGKDKAEAIAVNGVLYNTPGHAVVAEAPEAVVLEADLEEYLFANQVRIERSIRRIGTTEDAVCDLDSMISERLAALENAICKLTGIISGGGEGL